MTRSSSIRHPAKNRYIQLFEWQVKFCKGNHSAAMLLSHFSSWHDWKLNNDQYYRRLNDIAETHGDNRPHNENAYLFFTMDDLLNACMNLFGKQAIRNGLEMLVQLDVISIHNNPNPRYHFDKTKYFRFYPAVCNRWVDKNFVEDGLLDENNAQVIDNFDNPELDDGKSESGRPSDEYRRPSFRSGRTITDTTNNNTNKNKSITATNDFHDHENIFHQLQKMGMQENFLTNSEDLKLLAGLMKQGASIAMIHKAYDLSEKATRSRGKQFGIRYLAKVVDDLLKKEKSRKQALPERSEAVYENDFSGGLEWMSDLVNGEQGEGS